MIRAFLIVQAAGAVLLAAAIEATDQSTLQLGYLWPYLFSIGGVGAAAMAALGTRELPWAATGTLIGVAMIGRGIDLATASDDPALARPLLAVAVWLIMGLSTLTAWAVVGALDGVDQKR